MTYTCKICGASSENVTFYKGVSSRCAECHRQKIKENRDANAEYYRAYDAKRFKEDPKVRQRHARYAATPAGRQSLRRSKDKWKAQNPSKRAAHVIVGNAVRDGKIIKPDCCQVCGSKTRIHGHHHDYTKPLDVVWVCPPCHAKIHKEEGD